MESSPQGSSSPKSNRSLIIGIVVVILLCCCLIAFAVAGYYGYQAYVKAQSTIDQIQNIEVPTAFPVDPNNPNGPTINIPDITGHVPEGGLADTETRTTAWLSIQVIAAISGCQSPTADGTTITVVQDPDSSGAWKEEWNVNCGGESSQTFPVEFTPENGVVNVTVDIPGQ